MINQQRLLDEFCELVMIDCSTGNEREAADIVTAKLAALGMTVFEDNAGEKINGNCGNVFGYLPGGLDSPVLLLSAHLDCVEPCQGIVPRIRDGVITSGGNTVLGADNKAGVAGILEALRVIRENNIPHGDIQVVFTVAEEGYLGGSRHMDPTLLKADLGYVLDTGGTPGRIINAAPGQNNLRVRIRGKAAHAGSAPEEGINAIVVASKAIAGLPHGRIDFETTMNVGVIKGGLATNIIPDEVEILCETRSHAPEKLRRQTQQMIGIFEKTALENGARVDIETTHVYDSYVHPGNLPVVALAKRAAERLGLASRLEATGGGSDANYFNVYGVPTAVLAVGMTKVKGKKNKKLTQKKA